MSRAPPGFYEALSSGNINATLRNLLLKSCITSKSLNALAPQYLCCTHTHSLGCCILSYGSAFCPTRPPPPLCGSPSPSHEPVTETSQNSSLQRNLEPLVLFLFIYTVVKHLWVCWKINTLYTSKSLILLLLLAEPGARRLVFTS